MTLLWPSVLAIGLGVLTMWLLSLALRTLPVGLGYALWHGLGTLGVLLVGMTLYGETLGWRQGLFLALLLLGLIGLAMTEPGR
jgi:quaternary ammonium compound-resistance protein SugE